MGHVSSKAKAFYRGRKGDQVTRLYDTVGMARSMRTRTWGRWDRNLNKTVTDGAVIEYVLANDWKLMPDGLQEPPEVAVAAEDKPQHTATIRMTNSMINDPNMPMGHIIGQEIYNTLCKVYEKAQANDEIPGKLIIESSEGAIRNTTDYHISLFTTKVE